jgi:2,4-dienoyl-CoA reductase-like NADH-dependent reductase (Old Yellow Enzyme family)
VHRANGSLIAQFLDSTANTRTDQWGGSIENRSSFGLEVLKAVIHVFGRNVAINVSPSGGLTTSGRLDYLLLNLWHYSFKFIHSMPLKETLDTYRYFIAEADKLNLSYITLFRYTTHANFEIEIDGEHPNFSKGSSSKPMFLTFRQERSHPT